MFILSTIVDSAPQAHGPVEMCDSLPRPGAEARLVLRLQCGEFARVILFSFLEILVHADARSHNDVLRASPRQRHRCDPDDMGFGTQGFDGRLSLKSTPRRIIERRY